MESYQDVKYTSFAILKILKNHRLEDNNFSFKQIILNVCREQAKARTDLNIPATTSVNTAASNTSAQLQGTFEDKNHYIG